MAPVAVACWATVGQLLTKLAARRLLRGGDATRHHRSLLSCVSLMHGTVFLSFLYLALQELVDEKSRVHCSLNLNTETGRLSARKPNLQNQPALEKDQYKIRVRQMDNATWEIKKVCRKLME